MAAELCTDCQACVEACREGAIVVEGQGPAVGRQRCVDCGQCAEACATGALTIARRGYRVLVGRKLGRHAQLAT